MSSLLIRFSSNLQITRTGIQSRTSLNSGQILLWSGRFGCRLDQNCACHGNQKLQLTYIAKTVSPRFLSHFDRNFVILAGIQVRQRSWTSVNSGRIGQLTSELLALEHQKKSHRHIMRKWCVHASTFLIDRIFVTLAGNQDSRKISDRFEFWPDMASHFGFKCPWATQNSPYTYTFKHEYV